VQLEEDPINLPLHEERYGPLFAAMNELGAGVWLHRYRTPGTPGSPPDTAPFLLWQVYGWTFDTTITIARLVLAGICDRHPGVAADRAPRRWPDPASSLIAVIRKPRLAIG
jgi:aminocarboxymuconate-semialdehyde decarboxylase